MAIVLPKSSATGARPLAAGYSGPPQAVGGCASCCVRKYCAMYAPAHAGPPANCPFGPGPDAPRRD